MVINTVLKVFRLFQIWSSDCNSLVVAEISSPKCGNLTDIGLPEVIRPLSDTVPLWSGSSYHAFVYIGNEGFCFAADCKCYNCTDKCRFIFGFQVKKGIQEVGTLKQVELAHLHNVIAIVNKKAVNRTVSFDKWASAT